MKESGKQRGSAVSVVVIIIILAVGAWYIFSKDKTVDMPTDGGDTMMEGDAMEQSESDGISAEQAAEAEAVLGAQSNGDDLADIENDLDSTDFSSLENEPSEENFQ